MNPLKMLDADSLYAILSFEKIDIRASSIKNVN